MTESPPPNKFARILAVLLGPLKNPRIQLFLKLAFTAGLLTYLFTSGKLDVSQFNPSALRWGWLALALLLFLPPYLISSLRFKVILNGFGFPCAYGRALAWTMIGSFFNVSLPSATGGDVVKVLYVVKAYGKERRALGFVSVLVDRVAGLAGLITFSLLACCLNWSAVQADPRLSKVPFFLIGLVTCMAVGIGMMASVTLQRHPWRLWLVSILPAGRKLEKVYAGLAALTRHPLWLCEILGLSVLNHCVVSFAVVCLTYGLGQDLPPDKLLIVIPMALFFNVFGLFGGFGAGTAAFSYLFQTLLQSGAGAQVGLAQPLLSNLCNLLGLPVYLAAGKLDQKEVAEEAEAEAAEADKELPPEFKAERPPRWVLALAGLFCAVLLASAIGGAIYLRGSQSLKQAEQKMAEAEEFLNTKNVSSAQKSMDDAAVVLTAPPPLFLEERHAEDVKKLEQMRQRATSP